MYARDLLLIDYETTGTAVQRGHEPVQVGVVRLDRDTLQEKAVYTSTIRPLMPECADPRAMKVNGLDLATLRRSPPAEQVLHELEQAVFFEHELASMSRSVLLCAWSATFDRPFHETLLERAGLDRSRHGYQWTCAMSMAIAYADRAGIDMDSSSSLQHYCERFGIERNLPHDALADVRATAQVLRILRKFD